MDSGVMSLPKSSGLTLATSPVAESTTTAPRADHAAIPTPQNISIQENETDRTNNLHQRVFRAVQASDWQFVKQEISKLGPDCLAGMTIITQRNPVVFMTWNPLCIIISAIKDKFTQRASILDTVKSILDNVHSKSLRSIIVNRAHSDGRTPLHVATSLAGEDSVQIALVEYLLGQGANAAAQDLNGWTPLHMAVANRCEGNVRVLLKYLTGATHRLYGVKLVTTVDHVLAAYRDQTAATASVVDGNKLHNPVHDKFQTCMNLLEDYQNQRKDVPNTETPSPLENRNPSSLCMSSAYVMRAQSTLTNTAVSQVTTTRDWLTLHMKPVTDMLERPVSLLEEFRAFDSSVTTVQWIHLPAHNLEWVGKAAKIVLGSNENVLKSALSFIEYLQKENKFSRPGFYNAWDDRGQSTELLVQCSVLPILDVNKRAPLHCRHCIKHGHKVQDQRRNCLNKQVSDPDLTENFTVPSSTLEQRDFWTATSRLWEAHEKDMLSLEQTLDEYCYRSLRNDPAKLDQRDQDQVLSRYYKNRSRETSGATEEEQEKPPQAEPVPERPVCVNSAKTNEAHILVVSHLLVWRFDDLVITTYGDRLNHDSPNLAYLRRRVWTRCQAMQARMTTTSESSAIIVRCILEEAAKHEPVVTRHSDPMHPERYEYARLLDGEGPFSSEIAVESDEVTKSYQDYERTLNLGQIEVTYKKSVLKETQVLERLDDILNEIAMIRRVQEDVRLVCLDNWYDIPENYSLVNSWVERGRSKLERLENEALRVRQSLVTLLSLKQREVNAEGLINSELQSEILFVFAAATVIFTPLSWISSIMALDIKGFTPTDSKWSIPEALVRSFGTLIVFAILAALVFWTWRKNRARKVRKTANTTKTANMTKKTFGNGLGLARLSVLSSKDKMYSEGGTDGQKLGV